MDATHGHPAGALSRLSQEIRLHHLFCAVEQVHRELAQANPQLDEQALDDCLEFHANPSLGFQRSDVERVEFIREGGVLRARLQLNIIGLFGANSPLPAFYSEQVLADGLEGRVTRDFLDVFHHRLQRLLLPIWRKYRYQASYRSGERDAFSRRMFALMGLGSEQLRSSQRLNWKRLLPYLGLLSLRAHSAALVEAVLRYYFAHPSLHIEQCLEREVEIQPEQRNRLGRANSVLGDSLVLGERVHDRGGKFRIHIRELDWQGFHDFLPIGAGYLPLCELVRFVLRDPLDYDLQLQIRRDEMRELHLGHDNTCRLGWTSWLGLQGAEGLVTLSAHGH